MDPIVISATIQEFNGVRYYFCGHYFQRKGVRLHLAVWWHHHGIIPPGHHIHHKDENRSNNAIENFERLEGREHRGLHGKASGERGRDHLKLAQVAAAAWHQSEAGQRWHIQHGQNLTGREHPRTPAICQVCGENFMAAVAQIEYAKFCGPNCKAKDFRRRHRDD